MFIEPMTALSAVEKNKNTFFNLQFWLIILAKYGKWE